MSQLRNKPSVSVDEIILHNGQETRAITSSMSDGASLRFWKCNDAMGTYTYEQSPTHEVRVQAEEGEELALVGALIQKQGLDSAIVLMYILSCLSPDLDTRGNFSEWIDTAEAAKKCGLLTTETKARKQEARIKVTDVLVYGERATVIGKRQYKEGKSLEKTSIHSSLWGITDVEYLDLDEAQNSLPPSGRQIPLNSLVPPVRVYVQLSAKFKEMLVDPEWRQYLVGLRAVAKIPAGQLSGQVARAIGFAFMSECRMQMKAAAEDLEKVLQDKPATSMQARPRRWWLENFGFNPLDYADRPGRLLEAWAQALATLSNNGGTELIARKGEAASVVASRETRGHKHRNWFQEWLDEPVRFAPGNAIADQIMNFKSSSRHSSGIPAGVRRILLQGKAGRPSKNYLQTGSSEA